MDSMVRTALDIEREIDDARSIRDTGASDKRKEGQPFSSSGKKQKTSCHTPFLIRPEWRIRTESGVRDCTAGTLIDLSFLRAELVPVVIQT